MISPLTEVAGEFRRVAAYAAPLRRHRVITHLAVTVTALAVAVGMAIPTAPVIQAGLQTTPREGSILPASLGIGVAGTAPVVLTFPGPMDTAAVAAGLGLAPATDVRLRWNTDATSVSLLPSERWIVDERYVVHIPAGTAMADGGVLATDWRASFTTQVAPHVVRLNVEGVDGAPTEDTPIVVQDLMASTGYPDAATSAITDDATPDASSGAEIGLTFNAAMNHAATEAAFRIAPAIAGTLRWEGTTLWFVARPAPRGRHPIQHLRRRRARRRRQPARRGHHVQLHDPPARHRQDRGPRHRRHGRVHQDQRHHRIQSADGYGPHRFGVLPGGWRHRPRGRRCRVVVGRRTAR